MPDKRNYARVQFVENAQVNCAGAVIDCRVLDIALKGVLLQFPPESVPQLTSDQEVTIIIALEGRDLFLEFQAYATHFNDSTIGFRFTSMDSDSITHLRRLLELNSGDPEEIYRELSYMINS